MPTDMQVELNKGLATVKKPQEAVILNFTFPLILRRLNVLRFLRYHPFFIHLNEIGT